MSSSPATPNKYLSKQYRDGIYIPAGLIVVGCLIAKRDWVPYAIALAAVLTGYKLWSMRKYPLSSRRLLSERYLELKLIPSSGERKVLKPTEFQNFELKEKTIISHNVAM
jgi:cytochrome-b5 reductase